LVSVVIPTYKRYELARRAIQNAHQQTYEPLQIVVVEDGSDSGIEQYIRNLNDPRLTFYSHATRRGLAAARNTGTKIANGDYVAFLDDDDEWLPEKSALQVEVLESYRGQRCLVYCGTCRVSDGQIVDERIPAATGPMASFIYKGYTLPQSCMVVSRDALLSIGGHSDDLVSCIDHDIWMKMARAGFEMDFVPRALVCTRRDDHASRMTKRLDERLRGIEQFFGNWKPVVVSKYGMGSWRNIEGIYHRKTIYTIRSQYLDGVITKQGALAHLRHLVSLQSHFFPWIDYFAFRAGLVSFIPIQTNVKRIATAPVRVLGRWMRRSG